MRTASGGRSEGVSAAGEIDDDDLGEEEVAAEEMDETKEATALPATLPTERGAVEVEVEAKEVSLTGESGERKDVGEVQVSAAPSASASASAVLAPPCPEVETEVIAGHVPARPGA